MRRLTALFLCLTLAACQLAGPGGAGLDTPPATEAATGTITGAAVATTSLDAPPPAKPTKTPASRVAIPPPASVVPAKSAAEKPVEPTPAKATGTPVKGGVAIPPPAVDPGTDPAAEEPAAAPEPAPEETALPDILKSPEQLACERKSGVYITAGKSGIKTCARRTKDGGKRCKTGRDCQGECLARSGTCSPQDPLFGCNDILQDDGREVSLCID